MFFIVLLCIPLIDQGSKVFANLFLQPQGILPVINNAFYLNYTETPLWPFAMFERGAGVLAEAVISVLLLLAGYFTYMNRDLDDGVKWCIALILGGIFSNLIDMIRVFRYIRNSGVQHRGSVRGCRRSGSDVYAALE